MTPAEESIWNTLKGVPVALNKNTYIENSDKWELAEPRLSGKFVGSRVIGEGNFSIAFEILSQIQAVNKQHSYDIPTLFTSILYKLEEDNLIRIKPEIVRSSFRVVD